MSSKTVTPDNLSEVLNYLLNKEGICEAALAREIELPRNTINRLTTGKCIDPRISTLQAVANYFQVSLDQLSGKAPITNQASSTTEIKQLPIIDIEKTPQWQQLLADVQILQSKRCVVADSDNSQAEFAVMVKGDAMWPQFQEGNIIIINPHKQAENRDFVLTSIHKTGEIILRQLFIDNALYVLKAINPIFPSVISLTGKDKIIGVAVETRIRY